MCTGPSPAKSYTPVPKSSVQLEVVVAEVRKALIQPKGLHTCRQGGQRGQAGRPSEAAAAAPAHMRVAGRQIGQEGKEKEGKGLTQCAMIGYTNMTIMSSYSM
jgi:hypothetical protein